MEVIYMKTNKTMVMNHTLWNVFQADEYNLKKRLILRKGLKIHQENQESSFLEPRKEEML